MWLCTERTDDEEGGGEEEEEEMGGVLDLVELGRLIGEVELGGLLGLVEAVEAAFSILVETTFRTSLRGVGWERGGLSVG